jgi:cytochrome P450
MLADYSAVDTTDTFAKLAAAPEDACRATTGELILVRYADVRALLPARDLTTQRPQRDVLALEDLPPGSREVQTVMKAHYGKWPLFSDGDYHARLRRHLVRSTSELTAAVATAAREHVTAVARDTAGRSFSWLETIAEPIAVAVIGRLLGVLPGEAERLIDWARVIVRELGWPVIDDERAFAAVRAQRALADWFGGTAPAGRGTTRYTRALRAIADDPALGFESAVATLAQTLTGAYDPLVSAITTLATTVEPAALATLPAPTVAEEVLRLAAPFRFARRFTTAPTRLAGVDVPADCRIFLALAAADLDPGGFPQPTVMRSGRGPHVAFGLGRHYCIGADLVRSCLTGVVSGLAAARATFTAVDVRHAPELSILRFTAADGHWRSF